MNTSSRNLAFVINIHEKLVRDFPHTNYRNWCAWVHRQNLSPREKWERILSWTICPSDYESPTLFRYDWQLFKLLSKFVDNELSAKDKDVAYVKFLQAEDRCSKVNKQGVIHNSWSAAIMHRASQTVSHILGDLSPLLERFQSSATGARRCDNEDNSVNSRYPDKTRFGPGVSVGLTSPLKTLGEKVCCSTSTSSHSLFNEWYQHHWHFGDIDIVNGSCLTFVPKRVGEARTICYEPCMNMRSQLMVGQYIRERLKAIVDIDLLDQSRNRSLAKLGSLCDSYCTIDLSSASDLNSYRLVLDLLPFDWFHLLDLIRSHRYFDSITKTWRSFEKFSTMGNGFTFELETLLFYSIVEAAIFVGDNKPIDKREISVYGDDIIVPKDYYSNVVSALTMVGHVPNLEKSFRSGPFRESCGGDYFRGINVTPLKIKELHLEKSETVLNVYNGLFYIAIVDITRGILNTRFSRALDYIKSRLDHDVPKLGRSDIERRWSNVTHEYYDTRSNRWMYSFERENVRWSKDLQCFIPKYIFKRSIRHFGYEVHPLVAKYISSFGGQPHVPKDSSVKLVYYRPHC